MLHPKFKKDTNLKEAKNGKIRMTKKNIQTIKIWRQENQMSQYLTVCHKNNCGRSVAFLKINNKYFYHCLKCNNTSFVEKVIGEGILGF